MSGTVASRNLPSNIVQILLIYPTVFFIKKIVPQIFPSITEIFG